MSYVMAIDQGTTQTTVRLVDHDGEVVATASAELTQHYPEPGWVEHDATEILEITIDTLKKVVDGSGISAAEIEAIGITNQRETTVFWDKATGRPVANAIVWQDRRTLPLCEVLEEFDGAGILDRTGAAIVPNAAATKIKWFLDNNAEIRAGVDAGRLICGTIDTWLIWNLTRGKRHVTDRSNASVTLLLNARTREYDEEILAKLEIPREILPELVDSSEVLGTVASEILGHEIPIAGINGDQTSATFGQACVEPGMVKSTYGTGAFIVMNVGAEYVSPSKGIMAPVLWTIGDRVEYGLEGYADASGAAIQWLRDVGLIESATEVNELAPSVPDNGGVYFVPAFAGLGSPHFDSYARGTVFGLTRGTTKAHLARAVVEAIAHQVRDALRELERCSGVTIEVLRVDGGGSMNDFLMQYQSDILGIPVERPRSADTTALGAAYLAGLAVGFWKDVDEIAATWTLDKRYEPQMGEQERTRVVAGWERAVDRSRGWLVE
jgi:glycerol kinase